MKILQLFKHTAIYGMATVLPRLLNIVLTPLHIGNLQASQYGVFQGIFAYLILGNVLLTYGMETAFFRFANKEENSEKVQKTALTALLGTSLMFLVVSWFFSQEIGVWLQYPQWIIQYAILILVLDTLVVIPFSWFRFQGKSLWYASLKIANVGGYLLLNLFFFLGVPFLLEINYDFWKWLQVEDKIHYVFLANFLASLFTFLTLLPLYKKIGLGFNAVLFKKMVHYGFPILLAGIAFSINEAFDRIFIRMFVVENSDEIVGIYAACYKMGVFMSVFITAYKLGVEPFFFSSASKENAPEMYAEITRVFTAVASFILLFITAYTDVLKRILIPNSHYWNALWIVPFILVANLCLGIYHSLSVWYKVTDKTQYGAYISLLGSLVTIVGNILLIPLIGYKGAAVTTMLSYGTMLFVSFFIGQKKYPIPYKINQITSYLGVSVLFSFINFYYFERNMLTGSFFVFLFLTMGFYFEKERIQQFIKQRKK